MSSPSVLVLVPSYNHGAFIGDRIRSILSQTFGDFELHVVDDCSTDSTMDVLSGLSDPRLSATARPTNSGSPFSAWLDASDLLKSGRFDYVWVAESDDRAEPHFLERAVDAFRQSPSASIYYCHSWFIDDADLIIGHSINYLKRIFAGIDWDNCWQMSGREFIRNCLIKGMAIPNMSSALVRASAFTAAVRPTFAKYKLAADWMFAIHAALTGDVVFDAWDGNYFRHHERTSRKETNASQMLFEHMSATRAAFLSGAVDRRTYSEQMRVWTGMYRRERVPIMDFVRSGWRVSRSDLPECLCKLAGI
jgi:glycosyltransferase involved in cell wall biosynthesis